MAVPEGQNGSCTALLGAWQANGGLGRDAEALEEAVPCRAPSSSHAGVRAQTGLCGGKEWWYTLGGAVPYSECYSLAGAEQALLLQRETKRFWGQK